MKLNECIDELNELFENQLNTHPRIFYTDYKIVDTARHIRLSQDEDILYYARKTREIFITAPKHIYMKPLVEWQIKEAYRVINTALASTSPSLSPIRESLTALKKKFESDDFLARWLEQIDSGNLSAELVCSGHGAWYSIDGEIDLTQSSSTVVVYTALGATISDDLGIDIENEQYDDKEVVIKHATSGIQHERHFSPSIFNSQHQKKVPNFCLIDGKNTIPHPRVIEPMTGRVMLDMQKAGTEKNYISLSTIIERFPNRRLNWAACTNVRGDENSYLKASLEFWGCMWSKKSKKRRRDEEEPAVSLETDISPS